MVPDFAELVTVVVFAFDSASFLGWSCTDGFFAVLVRLVVCTESLWTAMEASLAVARASATGVNC